ncbi:hypothetical protein [Natronorubrum halophilum]|uniref:hypothetical protein n=1 Tax=Natronorubrum halophilum TaxID=1702106 RepID=UPI0010C17170|nr:hypothetical protein [Natronorubrum halophilum]
MTGITLRVDDSDGTTKTTVTAQNAEKVEALKGEMDHGEVVLSREAWSDVDDVLERRTDHLVVDEPTSADPYFSGRFDDDKRGDGTVTVSIAGYERDSKDAQPTGANVVYQNVTDSSVVGDLLDLVPTLEAGTVETLATNLSMSFSYAEPSKANRDTAEATGAELRYNYDQTVDYVDRRGSDRPEVVLSPESQTIVGSLEITEDAREEVTHIRGFGAQSGPDQVTAEAVADSYDGGKQIWRKYENKDIQETSRLQRIIDQMVDEYDGEPRHLEVKASVAGVDVDVGDRVTVQIPREGIDRTLRVMKRRSILGTAGAVLELVLSNRLLTRSNSGRQNRKDLQRFNRGYQGFVDRAQITSGWNPAGDGTPQELVVVNWPDDIVEEHDVTLAVQGRAWRSPVTPLSHSHSVSISSHSHGFEIDIPEHEHGIDLGQHSHSYDLYAPSHGHATSTINMQTDEAEGHDHPYLDNVPNDTVTGATVTEETTGGGGDIETTTGGGGGVFEETTTSGGGGTSTTTGSETPLSPEITDVFDGSRFYPNDVTVSVNGSVVGTIAGDDSSSWTETIDLEGELTSGLNTITATPDSRGELNLSLSSELFRRGRSE